MTLEEFKKRYYLFKVEDIGNGRYIIYFDPKKKLGSPSQTFSDFSKLDLERLDQDHMNLMTKYAVMDTYPNLYPYVMNGKVTHLWVCRDGRDAESITSKSEFTHEEMEQWNKLAGEAKKEDWFFCSLCKTPKPKEEYGYYYFASTYCKDCRDKNPEYHKRALAEGYN